MSKLTSQQRKLVYLAGILVLLIPIIALGMPASSSETTEAGSSGALDSGGQIARLRQEYDLGEATIGNVDPSSATMNLVLLGLRGVAVNLLWIEHDEYKKTKNWAQMRATSESITMLQPHYIKVWQYQGWDLAFNVSAEWDRVADRYYWVKEGGKFIMEGSRRNRRNPDLYWESGRVLGPKIGRSDEWQYFRRFYNPDGYVGDNSKPKGDPDPRFDGGVDPEFNPEGKDNYLAAKDRFHIANDADEQQRQHIMMRMLFRHYPARAQFDYAGALQREGRFGDRTAAAWEEAYRDWTQRYRNGDPGFGQELIEQSPAGKIRLAATKEDLEALSREDGYTVDEKQTWVDRYQKMTNYNYWLARADAERSGVTDQAHQEIFAGEELIRRSQLVRGLAVLQSGMAKLEQVIDKYGALQDDESTIEEALMAVLYFEYAHNLLDRRIPEEFPLKKFASRPDMQVRRPDMELRFRQQQRGE